MGDRNMVNIFFGCLKFIAIVLLTICFTFLNPVGWYMLLTGVASLCTGWRRGRTMREWLALESLWLAFIYPNANHQHSISGETGYRAANGCRTSETLQAIINFIFLKFADERDHCYQSIKWHLVKTDDRKFKNPNK